MLYEPSPKQSCQRRSLMEVDIPRIVDTFVKAQDERYRCQTTPDSDKEVNTEDEDTSDNLEAPLIDEELSDLFQITLKGLS